MAGNDAYTKLLMHFNESPFVDSSPSGHAMTTTGAIRSDTQSVFGGYSAYISGGSNVVYAADSADWYFGTGDFTLDLWVYFNSFPQRYNTLLSQWNGGAGVFAWAFDLDKTNNYLQFAYSTNGAAGGIAAIAGDVLTWDTETWYHLACVRDGADLLFFRDGVDAGSGNISTNTVADINQEMRIGASGDGNNVNAYLDEARISKGIARWTEDFTPPEEEYFSSTMIREFFTRRACPVDKIPTHVLIW